MTNQKKILTYLLFGLLLLIGSYLIYSDNNCPEQAVRSSTSSELPDLIPHVWPAPESKLSMVCYYGSSKAHPPFRGISVILRPASIIDLEIYEGSAEIDKPFTDRVYLYVDEVQISNSLSSRLVIDNLVGLAKAKEGVQLEQQSEISSEYTLSWKPVLMPGQHLARIVIETKTGETLEYRWEFVIW